MEVTIHSGFRLVFPSHFIMSEKLTEFRYIKLFYRKNFLYITFGSGGHSLYFNHNMRTADIYKFIKDNNIKLSSTFKSTIIKINKYKYKICLMT